MSRQYGLFVHHIHIADGFADDCEELIHRCVKHGQLTYQAFCAIWKEMNFAAIYQGRMSGAEISELSEELLHVAKHYMVANTSNFEESVAGVFLVYALYHLQPMSGFAPPRLIPGDITALTRIEKVARRESRLDVLYALGDILTRAEYHAEERPRGLETGLRKYFEGYTGVDRLGVRPKGVFFRQNEEQDLIRELTLVTGKYGEAKAAIVDENNQLDRSLQYTDPNLAKELDSSLRNLINGIVKKTVEEVPSSPSAARHSSISALKARAARAGVQPLRHLTGVLERESSPKKPSPKKKSELKAATGKVKSGSPKKSITSSSPKKRKVTAKKDKKRKIIFSSDEEDDDDDDFLCDDDDDEVPSDEEDPLNLDAFDKEVTKTGAVEIEVNLHNVFVDKLAYVIQGTEGIEIEVIDHMQPNTAINVENKTTNEDINDAMFKMPHILTKTPKRKVNKTIERTFNKLGLPGVVSTEDSTTLVEKPVKTYCKVKKTE